MKTKMKQPSKSNLKLKQILVPVDFSASSWKAVEHAIAFARQFRAKILLFHVLTAPPITQFPIGESIPYDPAPYDTDLLKNEAAKQLTQWRKASGSGFKIETALQVGIAHHEIVNAAKDHKIDLIIIGHRGRSGLAHFLLGSTAERVVRHSSCPVLVVRERKHDILDHRNAPPTTIKRLRTRVRRPVK